MKIRSIVTIALAVGITACGNSNEKAVGLYKHSSFMGNEIIAEVKKDGETYLFIEDVIRGTNAMALTESADGLSYNDMSLKLSEDGNTIYFGPMNGIRVGREYLSERLELIENNKKACAALQGEVDANEKNMQKEQWNDFVGSIKSRTPADCRIVRAGMRW